MPERPISLDRQVRRLADNLGFTLLWGWLLVSLFFVPTWLGYWWIGALLFFLGLALCWQAAAASTHPVYVVGKRREVSSERMTDDTSLCDECGANAAGGERRRYATRQVLFGTTVAVPEWGENVYCPECLEREASSAALETSADETDGDETSERGELAREFDD
ncbi:hypothetical protein [Natronosalvus caseinilyticus]|uniref:hypothetical protein n=1 Tax=Natronosalvus caseinilyticus TaxID=2953747 RepID=UPI0028B08885|nr:hypothetical protein [Natronosalvus caseinilyticus]